MSNHNCYSQKGRCLIAIISIAMMLMSCSNDKNDNYFIEEKEDISIELLLFNEWGQTTNEFVYGMDISFCLVFQNNSDSTVLIPPLMSLLGIEEGADPSPSDFMCVFAADGSRMGFPSDGISSDLPSSIAPHQFTVWQFCWLGEGMNRTFVSPVEHQKFLPVGSYYCQFCLHPDMDHPEKTQIIRKEFTIKPLL